MKQKSYKVPVFSQHDSDMHDQYWLGVTNQMILDEKEAQFVAHDERERRYLWVWVAFNLGCIIGALAYAGGWFF